LVWLFSPVNDRTRWTGDLWGLDRLGQLLIVENKLSSLSKKKCDPLADFVSGDVVFDGMGGTLFTADKLEEHWTYLYKKEMYHIEKEHRRWFNRCMPGVLPYSSKRSTLFRWLKLYDELTDRIAKEEYRAMVKECLAARRALRTDDEKRPHYFGVITVSHDGEPALTPKDKTNYKTLVKWMPDHVHLVSLRATSKNGGTAVIEAQEFPASPT